MPDWALTLNDTLFRFFTRGPLREHILVFTQLGLVAGVFAAWWSARLIARESSGTRRLALPAAFALTATTTLLFPTLAAAMLHGQSQSLVEGGSIDWFQWRLPYYFLLVTLLTVTTAIDFDQYLIPDDITLVGALIGVGWATLFGNMHAVPLWIDWGQVHPILGPYIPDWLKHHPHWHGFAFSLAGIITGAGVTWIARAVSQLVLGVEALGFGDVTLMAMIGSFLGWQPVLFVFLLAPLCGLIIGLSCKVLYGRRAIPYGPYLAAAAVIVLFTWRWLWLPTREVFGHGPTLAGLGGLIIVSLAALLGLLRLYRSIPVTRRAVANAQVGADESALPSHDPINSRTSPGSEETAGQSTSSDSSADSPAGEAGPD